MYLNNNNSPFSLIFLLLENLVFGSVAIFYRTWICLLTGKETIITIFLFIS